MGMYNVRPNRMHRNRTRMVHNEGFDHRVHGETFVGLKPELWWRMSFLRSWAQANKITPAEWGTLLLRRKLAKQINKAKQSEGDTLDQEV